MKTVQRSGEDRKRQFKAALALTGKTAWAFAAEHGAPASKLTRVLSGEQDDVALIGHVDAYIAKHLPRAL